MKKEKKVKKEKKFKKKEKKEKKVFLCEEYIFRQPFIRGN